MALRLIIPIVMFFVLLCSCERIKEERYIKKLEKEALFSDNFDNWEFAKETDLTYRLHKFDEDTIKIINFSIGANETPSIYRYSKQFPCNTEDTCYVEMHYTDTLFYYRQQNGLKNFVVGEYAYRFKNFKIDGDQLNYYFLHVDSLRAVKGNNLPDLPIISDSEYEVLEKLQHD